jgi:lipopolysaccharide transport protein LptA
MEKKILLLILTLILLSPSLKAEEESKNIPIVITSKRAIWNKEQKITILEGEVKVVRGEDNIYASKIKIWGDLDQVKKIVGYRDIVILNKKDKSKITGDYFEYHREEDYLFIRGNPKLILKEENLEITSKEMERYFKKGLSIAKKKVYIRKEDTFAEGELLEFFQDKNIAILTGNPKLIQNKNTFSGEKIIFYTKEDKIEITGNVKSTIYVEEGEKGEE